MLNGSLPSVTAYIFFTLSIYIFPYINSKYIRLAIMQQTSGILGEHGCDTLNAWFHDILFTLKNYSKCIFVCLLFNNQTFLHKFLYVKTFN